MIKSAKKRKIKVNIKAVIRPKKMKDLNVIHTPTIANAQEAPPKKLNNASCVEDFIKT
jgi:malic enzyme